MKAISPTKAATIAGFSLTLMTVLSLMVFPSLQANSFSIITITTIIILDVVIAWAFYMFFKPVNKNLASISTIIRVIYAFIFAIALTQIESLEKFQSTWDTGLALFGIHIFLLGYLAYVDKRVPKILGVLVLLTSVGYIIDGLGVFLNYTTQISIFTFFGEPIFGVWLLIKGLKKSLT